MGGYYPRADPIRPVDPIRHLAGLLIDHPVGDSRTIDLTAFGSARPEASLPPDASNTLYVEGVPADCSLREISHIFRPFSGLKGIRLVNKASKRARGLMFVLCFVEFTTPIQAAFALRSLQGYKFDKHDGKSANLKIQFSRSPGLRSSGRPLGRH